MQGMGLRWRGGTEVEGWKGWGLRGGVEGEGLKRRGSCCTVHSTHFPATSRQKNWCQQCYFNYVPYYSLFFLLCLLLSNLSWCMQWLQNATQDRCPQLVPTPGPNLYSYPVHVNITNHIGVHVTFDDNTIPVSHTSRSTNCF